VARASRAGECVEWKERCAMYVACVTVHVKPERVKDFTDAIFDNARNTRLEPGNVRFDVLQGEDDANRFLLYECYHTKEDFAKHQQTPHYLKWKERVADWMAQPRTSTKNVALFFGDGVL
jgi:autoinducer 2-degrading protein